VSEDGKLDPRFNGNIAPVAWRCEHCHKLQPAAARSYVLIVDEYAGKFSTSGAMKQRARFARKMVVDGPCRRSIMEVEEQAT